MTPKLSVFALFAALGALAGCASYNVGSEHASQPNGSYEGQTLNSSVSDQNPHPGGDASFPAGADQPKEPAPPDKVDGR